MIILDHSDKRPIYEQIVAKLVDFMAGDVLKENEALPSVRTMAEELSINPATVQRAYSILEQKGYIYSMPGKGNFIGDTANIKRLKNDEILASFRTISLKARSNHIDKPTLISILNDSYESDTFSLEKGGNDK